MITNSKHQIVLFGPYYPNSLNNSLHWDRFKFWTDGPQGMVFLGIEKCGKADEGSYSCVLTNRFGRREHKFKLFVSREYLLSRLLTTNHFSAVSSSKE